MICNGTIEAKLKMTVHNIDVDGPIKTDTSRRRMKVVLSTFAEKEQLDQMFGANSSTAKLLDEIADDDSGSPVHGFESHKPRFSSQQHTVHISLGDDTLSVECQPKLENVLPVEGAGKVEIRISILIPYADKDRAGTVCMWAGAEVTAAFEPKQQNLELVA